MNRKLRSVIGIGATALLLVSGATQATTLEPLFIFPNGLTGLIEVSEYGVDADPNKFKVNFSDLNSTNGGNPLWQVTAPVTFTGGDYGKGPGIFDPSPDEPWDYQNPSGDTVFFPAGPLLIFDGQDDVTTSTGSGFTVDFSSSDETLEGETITRVIDGDGIGFDYVMPGLPFVFVPPGSYPLLGTLITEIVDLEVGSIELEVTDNTVGNFFIGQLNILDMGSETPGTIDGRFWVAPEGGKYIPEPPVFALMGLGLLPLIRRRLKAA